MPTSPPDQIPAVTHHLLQLVGRLLHSLSVVAVHHEDKTLWEKPGWSRQLAQRKEGHPRRAAGTPPAKGTAALLPTRPPSHTPPENQTTPGTVLHLAPCPLLRQTPLPRSPPMGRWGKHPGAVPAPPAGPPHQGPGCVPCHHSHTQFRQDQATSPGQARASPAAADEVYPCPESAYLRVLEVVPPEGSDFVLATHIPDSEANVLVLHRLHVEPCGVAGGAWGEGEKSLAPLSLHPPMRDLQTWMKSPPSRLLSRLSSPSNPSLSSYERCSSPFTIAVALHRTHSSMTPSLLHQAVQHQTQHPEVSQQSRAEGQELLSSPDPLSVLCPVRPRVWRPQATRPRAWCLLRFLPSGTARTFSSELLSSRYQGLGLFLSQDRTWHSPG